MLKSASVAKSNISKQAVDTRQFATNGVLLVGLLYIVVIPMRIKFKIGAKTSEIIGVGVVLALLLMILPPLLGSV